MRLSVHQNENSSSAMSTVLIRPAFPVIHMPKQGKIITSRTIAVDRQSQRSDINCPRHDEGNQEQEYWPMYFLSSGRM